MVKISSELYIHIPTYKVSQTDKKSGFKTTCTFQNHLKWQSVLQFIQQIEKTKKTCVNQTPTTEANIYIFLSKISISLSWITMYQTKINARSITSKHWIPVSCLS